ncbi:MAG: transporter substrate-binding domain-containing protein [Burkholderiaceae bacterium]|nr:transporter substrate-binding domain-containing protein [Burkholderiaceae bacterium]
MKPFHRFALAAALLAVAAGLHAAEADAPAYVSVCVDDDNAPFSSEARPERGIDVEVAQAIAGQLGRPLKLVWAQVPNRGGIGKALRQTLSAGKCDAYLGIPQDPDLAKDLAERKLTTSAPYLVLGYVLVAAPGKPAPTVAALRGARRIGAVTATPADLYLYRKQLGRVPYPGSAALIEALKAGEIDLALVWSSALAGDAGKSVVAATEAVDDADLYTGMTVATRSADTALAKDLATAIEALRSDGRINAIMQRHGLPRIARP